MLFGVITPVIGYSDLPPHRQLSTSTTAHDTADTTSHDSHAAHHAAHGLHAVISSNPHCDSSGYYFPDKSDCLNIARKFGYNKSFLDEVERGGIGCYIL